MLWEILVLLVLCWFLSFRWQKRRLIKCAKQFKNDMRSVPIIGHSYTLFGSGKDRMSGIQALGREALQQGGVTAVWFGYNLVIMVADPEVAEWALTTCLEKEAVFRLNRFLTGEVLAIAPVHIWRDRRRLYTPAFSPRNLSQHIDALARHSDRMVREMQTAADSGPRSLYKYLAHYAKDSFFETTYGLSLAEDCSRPFASGIRHLGVLFAERIGRPWLHSETIYRMMPAYSSFVKHKKALFNCVDRIIRLKRKEMADGPKSRTVKSLLENLIESADSGSDRFTELDLRGEVVALYFGGIDTTSTTLGFTLNMLAENPDVQDKVFHEVTRVVGNAQVTADHLAELKYLEAVIKETLRLFPPGPIIARNVDRDVTMPDGRTLVGGANIMINIWALHRNPLWWGEDADQFRPERFLQGPVKPSAKFMPFSHGPRNCLGYKYAMSSMKTAMAALVRRYSVRRSSETAVAVSFNVTIKDSNKVTLHLITRETKL